jgi:2-polyprenyl-3-methyl-5-hydroxy-6-metoxy-1,4-benzoquinol methylase
MKKIIIFLGRFKLHISPVADTFAYNLLPNHFHFLVRIKPLQEIKSHFLKVKANKLFDIEYAPEFVMERFGNLLNSYTKSFNFKTFFVFKIKTKTRMTLQEAIALIQNEHVISNAKKNWADLGCGSGLFTHALANLSNEESIVYAIDKNISSFKKISSFKSATIKPVELNFENATLPSHNLDGIMMANSLHFVKDKKSFLEKVKGCLHKQETYMPILLFVSLLYQQCEFEPY